MSHYYITDDWEIIYSQNSLVRYAHSQVRLNLENETFLGIFVQCETTVDYRQMIHQSVAVQRCVMVMPPWGHPDRGTQGCQETVRRR